MNQIIETPPVSSQSRTELKTRLGRIGFAAFWVLCLAIAFGAPLPYFLIGFDDLADAGQGLAEHYVNQSAWARSTLLVHAGFSGLALLLTPIQASSTIRRRWPVRHRVSGRVSAGAIAVGAISGLAVAQVSYAGLSGTIGFSLLSVVWLYCLARSINHARVGQLAAHRQWSLRVMALTFAAVTLRLWLLVYIAASTPSTAAEADRAFDQIYSVTPFLSWVPNLLVIEWYVRRKGQSTLG